DEKFWVGHAGIVLPYNPGPVAVGTTVGRLGKIDESRNAYDQFFAGLTHADPLLPIVAAAKAEYASLKRPS
ncbi:MAG: hypothetical protein JF610_15885, partial [Acidobacteria bacterium]|nr:hypothetical protein [Acidobacteriota bacterium]